MLTINETMVLGILRQNTEGAYGDGWAQVYLDNARPPELTARQFAAILANLQQKGFYRSQGDDCFGDVKLSN